MAIRRDSQTQGIGWENVKTLGANSETAPYKGISMLLPIYEELEDGAEIIWQEHKGTKLKNIRKWVKGRTEFRQ